MNTIKKILFRIDYVMAGSVEEACGIASERSNKSMFGAPMSDGNIIIAADGADEALAVSRNLIPDGAFFRALNFFGEVHVPVAETTELKFKDTFGT